ncbi:acyl-CoA carboxylase biotin carboxyl carrier protein subunit [Bradyrhizobium sp. USDA 4454]
MAEIMVLAEMAGRILDVSVSEGDQIRAGQEIALIEAMKVEIPLTSPVTGIVARILCQPDQTVNEDEPLVVVKSQWAS